MRIFVSESVRCSPLFSLSSLISTTFNHFPLTSHDPFLSLQSLLEAIRGAADVINAEDDEEAEKLAATRPASAAKSGSSKSASSPKSAKA